MTKYRCLPFPKHELIFFTYNINIDYNDYYIEYRDFINIDFALRD